MNAIIDQQRIASLILKKKISQLDKQEQEELDLWRRANPDHEKIYRGLLEKDFSADLSRYEQIDRLPWLENYRKRYSPAKGYRLKRWSWAAAMAALLIGFSVIFVYRGNEDLSLEKTSFGNTKAILVLEDGNTIDLSARKQREILSTEKVNIRNNGSSLTYSATVEDQNKQSAGYNELIIPRGGEFMLVLADGTKVWLNSQSNLKYPVVFNETKREVYLEGEAYFEVAKNADRPFHVKAKNGVDIEVLGTSFNVRSYSDESSVETVLEEGVVRMTQGTDSVILSPGKKAVYLPGEAIRMTEVSTELYTAWKSGQYVFRNEKLENILKQLARWYDIEIVYRNEAVKSVVISGDVRKYEHIGTLLEAMEITSKVHFEMKGRTLVVSLEE